MIINHSGGVDLELFDKIIAGYNSLQMDNEKVFIYFRSGGGDSDIGKAITDFINRDPQAFHIVAYGEIMSAAWYIFFLCKCTKELLIGCTGMVHKDFYTNMPMTVDLKVTHYEKEQTSWKQAILDLRLRPAALKKIGLNNKELADYKDGKDVSFMYKRMKEFLIKQKPKVKNGKAKGKQRSNRTKGKI